MNEEVLIELGAASNETRGPVSAPLKTESLNDCTNSRDEVIPAFDC